MLQGMARPLPQLTRSSDKPLVEQIVDHYRSAIQQGRLRPGESLATIRASAEGLKVTRATVQEAYRRLAEAGLVITTVGRGTEVSDDVPSEGREQGQLKHVFSAGANAVWQQLNSAPRVPSPPPGTEALYNFADLVPDQELFPVDRFRDSIARVLRERGGDLLVYGHPMGDRELRLTLAARTGESGEADGPGDPEEILITSGAQQGIDLALRTFTSPGDAVAVAVPTYHHLFGLLRSHGLEPVSVPHGPAGIDMSQLKTVLGRRGVRLLYLMPTFQNPTGRSMDLEQRHELVGILKSTHVPVLEDEFQRDLRISGQPLPSLRSLDARDLTVTVQTFSKGLFPGIRTGWVSASSGILGRMTALKRLTDLDTSPLLQAALVDFIAEGVLDEYLGQLRQVLRDRHAAAQSALEQLPNGCTWTRPEGGFVLWLGLPQQARLDGERLAELAAERGVLVTPGRVFDPDGGPSRGVRLSLSRVSEAEIAAGIEILAECIGELLVESQPSQGRIFL